MYASTASFSSPGYPTGYPNLLSCEFTVMADEPLVAVFDSNFEIKPGDSLKVSNSTGFDTFYFLSSPIVLLSHLNICFLIIFFVNILTFYMLHSMPQIETGIQNPGDPSDVLYSEVRTINANSTSATVIAPEMTWNATNTIRISFITNAVGDDVGSGKGFKVTVSAGKCRSDLQKLDACIVFKSKVD